MRNLPLPAVENYAHRPVQSKRRKPTDGQRLVGSATTTCIDRAVVFMNLFKWNPNRLGAGNGMPVRDGLSHIGRWTFYYVSMGVLAGLGAVVFYYLCQLGMRIFLDFLAGYRPPSSAGEYALFVPGSGEFSRWVLLVLPACGGLLSGWLVYTFAPEAAGAGNDAAIHAYHHTEFFSLNSFTARPAFFKG
jgi:H+/Cl- antiporter ClcA